MSDQARKQYIIGLLTMTPKRIAGLDEQELVRTIQEIETVKADSVKDGRFLGELSRRGQRKEQTKGTQGRAGQA